MRQRHREADSNIDTSEVSRTSFVFRVEQNRRGYSDPEAPVKGLRAAMEFRHCTGTVSSSQAECKLCICRTHVVSFNKSGCIFWAAYSIVSDPKWQDIEIMQGIMHFFVTSNFKKDKR